MVSAVLTGEPNKARLDFIAWAGTEVDGAEGIAFLFSGLKRALFKDSREGCDLVICSVSMSNLLIAFFLLEPPLRVFGVLAGVFLPGVLRIGVLLPGVRLVRGLFLSDELTSFLCGKKLEKISISVKR